MPRFAGSVHGVVVQMITNTLRPASAGSINAGSLLSGNFTYTDGLVCW